MNKHRPAALVFAALFALHLLIFAGALWARRPPVWLVLAALAALWLADFGAFHLALHLDPANLKLHRRACQICALAGYGFLAGYLLLRTTRTDLVPLGALRVVFYELAHGHAGLGLALRQIALPLVSLTPLSFLLPRMAYAARKSRWYSWARCSPFSPAVPRPWHCCTAAHWYWTGFCWPSSAP